MTHITVIVPTRDRPKDLTSCLGGLARQDAPALLDSVIVVDDYSRQPYGEATLATARSHGLPLLYLRNRLPQGAAWARNAGAIHAQGEILAWLDDDAVPAANWLQVIASHVGRDATEAVTGRITPLDGSSLLSKARQLRYDLRQSGQAGQSESVMTAGNSALLKVLFEGAGGFDPTFRLMHDRELGLRLLSQGRRCKYVPEMVIAHRHSKGLRVAYTQAFLSARYRILLQERHAAAVVPCSFRHQLESLANLARLAHREPTRSIAALVACTTELAHTLGCLWYRFMRRSALRTAGVP